MSKTHRLRVLVLPITFLYLAMLACSPGGGEPPTITITSPASGTTVEVGEAVEIVSMAAADAGVANVILSVNAQEIRQDPPPSGNPTSFSVAQAWTPVAAGEVTISVVAVDADDEESDPAVITLQVVAAVAGGGDTPPEATPTSEPDVTGEGGCTLNASFVADVTIPDDTEIPPGTPFVKTWRLRNTGTCDWEAGFEFFFVSGDHMGGPTAVPAPPTAAGSSADLSVNLTSPATPGTYRGYWRMRTDTGLSFGTTVYVQIVVPAPTAEPTEEPTPEPTETPEPPPAGPVEIDIVADRDSFWWPELTVCMPGGCPDWGNEPVLELFNNVTGSPPFQLFDPGMIAIHFDLSDIPEGATIIEAELFLRLESSEGPGSASISAGRATSPWSEPDHSVKPICDYTGASSRGVGTGTGWYDWDVTDIVTQQYASPTTNHGFCLRGGDADQERYFHSREGNAITRPYLHVVYQP
jgi:hypothetical protein